MHPNMVEFHKVMLALHEIEKDFIQAKADGTVTDAMRMEVRLARKTARELRDTVGVFPPAAEYKIHKT